MKASLNFKVLTLLTLDNVRYYGISNIFYKASGIRRQDRASRLNPGSWIDRLSRSEAGWECLWC